MLKSYLLSDDRMHDGRKQLRIHFSVDVSDLLYRLIKALVFGS